MSCHARAAIFLGWVVGGWSLWWTQIGPQKYTTMANLQHGFAHQYQLIYFVSSCNTYLYIFFCAESIPHYSCYTAIAGNKLFYLVSCILYSSGMFWPLQLTFLCCIQPLIAAFPPLYSAPDRCLSSGMFSPWMLSSSSVLAPDSCPSSSVFSL